jgi:hypothetical protein
MYPRSGLLITIDECVTTICSGPPSPAFLLAAAVPSLRFARLLARVLRPETVLMLFPIVDVGLMSTRFLAPRAGAGHEKARAHRGHPASYEGWLIPGPVP